MTLNDLEWLFHVKLGFCGFLPTPIRMTLNNLECPIQLKVRFTDGTHDVCMLWLSELAMRE